jgi:hypothetical protein
VGDDGGRRLAQSLVDRQVSAGRESVALSTYERGLADGEGRPRNVWIAVEIQHTFDIDIKSESFAFDILIKMMWRCPNNEAAEALEESGFNDEANKGRSVGLNTQWTPQWTPRLKIGIWLLN